MKLVRVEFTKLFGYFDYSIDFHDTVTILHGLNGCGKTTMLQTINAVFNKEMDTIKSTDLQSVSFFFSTGAILKIDRKKIYLDPEKEKATGIIYLAYSIIENGKETVFDSFENTDEYQDIVKRFLKGYRPFPFLERINESTWYCPHDLCNGHDVFDILGFAMTKCFASLPANQYNPDTIFGYLLMGYSNNEFLETQLYNKLTMWIQSNV